MHFVQSTYAAFGLKQTNKKEQNRSLPGVHNFGMLLVLLQDAQSYPSAAMDFASISW